MIRSKKLLAILAAALCLFSFTACGQGNVSTSSVPEEESNVSSEAEESSKIELMAEADVEDTLEGLTKYMANNYQLGEAAETRGDIIGAEKKGYRYNSGAVYAEFYAYDPQNLSDTAKAVIESVKKDGSFEILSQKVENVYLSDSGKYLMVFRDLANTGDSAAAAEKAVAEFKAFKAAE